MKNFKKQTIVVGYTRIVNFLPDKSVDKGGCTISSVNHRDRITLILHYVHVVNITALRSVLIIRVVLFTLFCCWKTCMKVTFLGVSPVYTHVIQAVEQKRILRLTSESSGQCTANSMLDRDSMRN